jgi:hypothetical protein
LVSEKPKAVPSWWQTIPGILTGVAAIITAVTGLIVVVNRAGGRAEERVSPASQSVPGGPASGSRGPSPSSDATSRGDAQSVALPALNRVRLAGGDAVITILSAQVEPIDAERRSLKFLVRHLNAGRYDANFWSSSYRLIVDGVPRAPTNLLDEVVAGNSAKEGEVVFEVPVSAKDVALQISFGEEASRLPFKLP